MAGPGGVPGMGRAMQAGRGMVPPPGIPPPMPGMPGMPPRGAPPPGMMGPGRGGNYFKNYLMIKVFINIFNL